MEPTDQQDELAELRAKLATAERQRDEALELLREIETIAYQFCKTNHGIAGAEQQPETERP